MRSPCISKCLYNFDKNHCTGCFRTLEEIGSWWKLTETEKAEVLQRCQERRESGRMRKLS